MNRQSLSDMVLAQVTKLYKTSVISRVLSLGKHRLLDDRVAPLSASPLGMFFYNQRAILYGLAGFYILGIGILAALEFPSSQAFRTVCLLGLIWLVGAIITILRHSHFVSEVKIWAVNPTSGELPRVFETYFYIDTLLLLFLFVIGRILRLGIDLMVLILFANFLVYCAYVGAARRRSLAVMGVPMVLAVVIAFGLPGTATASSAMPLLFVRLLLLGPLLTLVVATPLSVAIISWLRTIEHDVTKQRLALFKRYGSALSDGMSKDSPRATSVEGQYSLEDFRRRVRAVITDLCDLDKGLGYNSGRLLVLQRHMDRGDVLVPYAQANVPPVDAIPDKGLVDALRGDALVRYSSELLSTAVGDLDIDKLLAAPIGSAVHAVVPLRMKNRAKGLLVLYGTTMGQTASPQEQLFLDAVGKILASSMEEWDARFQLNARGQISSLHSCSTEAELFAKAATMFRESLKAAGCMIVFRAKPDAAMSIVAADGLKMSRFAKDYTELNSQTGRCISEGVLIRYDNVGKHRAEFNGELLEQVERALGEPVRTWMAIPIGSKNATYGAIKVMNSHSYSQWFTDEDERLACDLALHLHRVIERFLHLQQIEEAKRDAQMHLKGAQAAKKSAENTAQQRQDDIMIITHQLQGPLAAMVGIVSETARSVVLRDWRSVPDRLDALKEFIEDAIALCYGIVVTFAKQTGERPSFLEHDIDAPSQLKLLARRLQKTSDRRDLTFEFKHEDNFPIIKMDKNVFTSVFYSLLHNAMKYADDHTAVVLECSRERSSGRCALKVKTLGEPIDPSEKETIFEKFKRGRVITATGRHHGGVGLGLWVARELIAEAGGTIHVELAQTEPRLSIFIVQI